MNRGRIVKALSGFYFVRDEEKSVRCRARGRFRKLDFHPLVGDWAQYTLLEDGSGILEEVEERRNFFQRPAVANVDQLVIVASEAIPKTDPYLIDRMCAIAELKQCEVLLCLNKCDLERAEELYAIYRTAKLPTLCISAVTGEGMDELKQRLSGKLSAFTGNSGVGKSTILNAMEPHFALATGAVSEALGRGRHTTRHVELFTLSGGAEVIDTPGFSSFDTEELSLQLKRHLPELFPEFRPYLSGCRFAGCRHGKEKGCAVREALQAGEISPSRYRSYLRLLEELRPLREWQEEKKR